MAKRKAYYVVEAAKGETLWLVHATNAREAKATYWRDGEAIDTTIHPNGIRSVRRAPEEDDQ